MRRRLPAARTHGRSSITTTGSAPENFKPLAALGGALGIGVWKNVQDLYTFVCRNYEFGDQIYGFQRKVHSPSAC